MNILSRIIFLRSLIAFAFLSISACSVLQDMFLNGWPTIGRRCEWRNIETEILKPSESSVAEVELDPYHSFQKPTGFYKDHPRVVLPPDKRYLRSDIALHVYPYVIVEGHYFGTGTHVYYLPEEGVFYLWGDDGMDHFDGMVGPFAGDPRDELTPAASPSVIPPMVALSGCG